METVSQVLTGGAAGGKDENCIHCCYDEGDIYGGGRSVKEQKVIWYHLLRTQKSHPQKWQQWEHLWRAQNRPWNVTCHHCERQVLSCHKHYPLFPTGNGWKNSPENISYVWRTSQRYLYFKPGRGRTYVFLRRWYLFLVIWCLLCMRVRLLWFIRNIPWLVEVRIQICTKDKGWAVNISRQTCHLEIVVTLN